MTEHRHQRARGRGDASAGSALIVTREPELRDALLQLVAAAGATADVLDGVARLAGRWEGASIVVVGGDLAEDVARLRLPRRPAVVLVGRDLDDARVWEVAVELGAESVVFLPDAQAWLVDRFADATEGEAQGRVVALLGGRGGAGETTLAAALAVTAARSRLRCMLVDGDPLGGGIDLALGGEDTTGLRWPDLSAAGGRVSSRALLAALPDIDGLAVLSCERRGHEEIPAAAMRSVLAAGRRSSDLVVVDLPRHLSSSTALVLSAADLTVLVVPAEVRATAAAARVAAVVAPLTADLRLVVRGPSPAGLSGSSVAEALALPLMLWLDEDSGVASAADRGDAPARSGRGALADACRELLARLQLGERPAA